MANGQLNLRTVKLGDNADTSKNFLIEVPAVADGTLTIKRENGTDVLSIAADGKVTIPNLNPQTIQDVKTSRAFAASYQNTTAQPITVMVNGVCTAASTIMAVVAGVSIFGSSSVSGGNAAVVFQVPAGAFYSVDFHSGTKTIISWVELR